MLNFIEDVRPDRYTANGIQVCYMLCTRLWGKARTMAHLPQVSIKPICCPCSDLCYLFFVTGNAVLFVFISFAPHHQRSVTGLVRKRHSLTLWQQSCYGVSERLLTEAKHEKTVHLGHKLPRLTLRQI